jgi:hypothetical protein
MVTIQAERLIKGLKEIGLKHGHWKRGGEFTVATEITRRRDRNTGMRYPEYGEAMAHLQTAALERVAENAQKLADAGHHVILVYSSDFDRRDGLVTAVVSTKYNPNHVVSVMRDGNWTTLPKEEAV